MTRYSFLLGRLDALWERFLDRARIDRMVGSATFDDAFRVLMDLEYSRYFDKNLRAHDYYHMLHEGMNETREMLITDLNNAPGLNYLWLRYDLQNLKRALKELLIEGNRDLPALKKADGYWFLGTLDKNDIEVAVKTGTINTAADVFSPVLMSVCNGEMTNYSSIETALDAAYMQLLASNKYSTDDAFLYKYTTFAYKNTLDTLLIRHLPLADGTHIDTSKYDIIPDFPVINTVLELMNYCLHNGYVDYNDMNLDALTFALKAERRVQERYYNFLYTESIGAGDCLALPYCYFERRLADANTIKTIMNAKMQGLKPVEIMTLITELPWYKTLN